MLSHDRLRVWLSGVSDPLGSMLVNTDWNAKRVDYTILLSLTTFSLMDASDLLIYVSLYVSIIDPNLVDIVIERYSSTY